MIKTYIYGIPNGFDFYEKDTELNDYFKGFYISSRRGRRLLINRRDNGDTVYSYLRYGMKEVSREPLHAFFGMSIVIGNYQYCPDFKILLEWFDYLFNKLVEERHIISKTENGTYRYTVQKFDENTSDVEWLKANLPNILTQPGQTRLLEYDGTFVDGKTGQVVCFDRPVSEKRLLSAFRTYRWVSVLSDIEMEDRSETAGNPEIIELSFSELNEKLNKLNQWLLPIAVDVSKGSADELADVGKEVGDIHGSIGKYLPSITDREDAEKFKELGEKYASLKSSINTLAGKMPQERQQERHQMQYCFSCKQNRPLSCFRSADATKCIECEKKAEPTHKVCSRCGKRKPMEAFSQGGDVCNDCRTRQRPVPGHDIPLDGTSKYLTLKNMAGLLLLLAVIVISVVYIPKACSNDGAAQEGGKVKPDTIAVVQSDNKIIKKELERLVRTGNFKDVYDYIADKENATAYSAYIKQSVNEHLWYIIDNTEMPPDRDRQSDITSFYISNKALLDLIGFDKKDQEKWEQITNDYEALRAIIRKSQITEQELQKGKSILKEHKDWFNKEWIRLLTNKQVVSPSSSAETSSSPQVGTQFTLTYTKASDGKPTTIDLTPEIKGVDAKLGTTAIVKCSDGIIKENKKNTIKIVLRKEKKYTINCNNEIIISVNSIEKTFTKVEL